MLQKKCSVCNDSFTLTDNDFALYQKFGFAPSDLCFVCDQRRRLCFRNERNLYSRKCDATGETIISIFSPDKPYKVYKSDFWHSDKWDALEYGQNFDPNRPFFEQMKELQLKVPRLALMNINPVNSDYCNFSYGNKNCYLVFGGDLNQDTMFGTLCMKNVNVLDADYSNYNELSSMLGDTLNSYSCHFAFDSKNCSNCAYISDCVGCNECILCANLVNQSYMILNTRYSKDDYLKRKSELLSGSYFQHCENVRDFQKLLTKRVVKYAHIVNSEECSGDYIKNSKNCTLCFDVAESQDLSNVIFANIAKDCFRCSLLGDNAELSYNSISNFNSYYDIGSFFVIDSSNIEYCDFILNSQHLFGCVGLKRKKYSILNKSYSEADYKVLRARIIDHMKRAGEFGHFLSQDLSFFGYNETTAHDYFPLSREEALRQGFKWMDEIEKKPVAQKYVIPDNISDVSDAILQEVLQCSECLKNFKIIPQELRFYHLIQLPVPRICPECRHSLRKSFRNPRYSWKRKCQKCNNDIETTYAPERSEHVYCEKCYLETIY
ncbi:hypothetical protein HYV57_04175 [Candidatus Peregrinibacteria bacterium]|nr:hypothetical protein [Candidatus Peregrinibacteria bacterium]